MKKIIIKTVILTLISTNIQAQKTDKIAKNGYSVGYTSYKLIGNGISLGSESYYGASKTHKVVASLNASLLFQKDIMNAQNLTAKIGQRYTSSFGLFLESYVGLGVQNSQFIEKTYELTVIETKINSNKINKLGLAPNLTLGLGYDFSKKSSFPAKLYLRPSFNWLYPDKNLVFQSSTNLEFGFIFCR